MSDIPCQTPRAELANDAREHYDLLATACCEWNSIIPEAIDAWEELPALRAENQRLSSLIKTMWPMLVASIDFTEHGTHKSLEAMRNYYQHNPLTPEQIDLMMEITE